MLLEMQSNQDMAKVQEYPVFWTIQYYGNVSSKKHQVKIWFLHTFFFMMGQAHPSRSRVVDKGEQSGWSDEKYIAF